MVTGYKRCPNGHFYKDDLAQCPYCSNSAGAANSTMEYGGGGAPMPGGGATMPGGGGAPMPGGGATIPAGGAMPAGGGMNDPNKTRVIPDMGGGMGNGMGGETVPNSLSSKSAEPANNNVVNTPPPAASKTMIFDDSEPGMGGGGVRSSRKLVGWLVSYTLSDMGVDFKLFEGRNVIGRDLDCQISVNDGTVSGKHAVLLYRESNGVRHYFIQDSLSTSGTRVNDVDTGVDAVPLKDGDEIKVGKTIFKFRSSF